MRKKRFAIFIVFFSILLLDAVVGFAAEYSATVFSRVMSEYLGVNGADYSKKPSMQNEAILSVILPTSEVIYLDFLEIQRIGKKTVSSDLGNEVDYTFGASRAFGDVGSIHPELDIGVTYFDFMPLWHQSADVVQPYLEVRMIVNHFTIFGREEVLVPLHRDSPNGGTLTHLGAKYNFTRLPSKHLPLFLMVAGKQEFFYDDGGLGYGSGFFWHHDFNFSWSTGNFTQSSELGIKQRLALNFPILQASGPFGETSDNRNNTYAIGAGLTLNF